jgi:GxxExxY protein
MHRNISDRVIGAAISVHRVLGPGFIESTYENALALELENDGLTFERQVTVPINYRGRQVGEHSTYLSRGHLWLN